MTDSLPAGVTYVSDNGGGAYNSGSGVWNIGGIGSGGSATLQITVTIDTGTTGTTITNGAIISGANEPDPNGGNNIASVNVNVN